MTFISLDGASVIDIPADGIHGYFTVTPVKGYRSNE